MKTLKRVVYHVDGKDYEENEVIELTFRIQYVSIQNVLNLAKSHHLKVKSYGNLQTDPDGQYYVKAFRMYGFANCMVDFLFSLGMGRFRKLHGDVVIRHNKFRQPTKIGTRYDGIICYDPVAHSWEMKSNSPRKIEGRQAIINGKLWRKYYSSNQLI